MTFPTGWKVIIQPCSSHHQPGSFVKTQQKPTVLGRPPDGLGNGVTGLGFIDSKPCAAWDGWTKTWAQQDMSSPEIWVWPIASDKKNTWFQQHLPTTSGKCRQSLKGCLSKKKVSWELLFKINTWFSACDVMDVQPMIASNSSSYWIRLPFINRQFNVVWPIVISCQ